MQQLTQFGLSHYEAKAVDILMKERVTPKQLSNRAKIPLGKVYSVLQLLKRRGFIDETSTRPKQAFINDPSIVIGKLIEQKQQQDEALYANARALALQASRVRSQSSSFLQTGVTTVENKEIQLRTFVDARREVCQIINIHHKPDSNRNSKTVWEREIVAAISRGVVFRCIYPKSAILPPLLQQLSKKKFIVRRLDTDFMRCDIIDAKKSMLKLVHKDPLAFGGIIYLEDERFARNLQGVFEQLWDASE